MASNVILPKIGESIFEGTITKWLAKEGDFVKKDEPLFEISTDKVDTEIPSPSTGVLTKIIYKEGQLVPINTVIAEIDETKTTGQSVAAKPVERKVEAPVEKPKPVAVQANDKPKTERVMASPLVRKMAKEEGVDISQISGTGWKGRITKQDVEQHMGKQKDEQPAVGRAETVPTKKIEPCIPKYEPSVSIPVEAHGPVDVVPMSAMRKKISDHMVLSRRISAHVTTIWEVDVTNLVKLREKEKDSFERVHEINLTFTAFFAVAAINAIKEYPIINSSVDPEGDKIVYKKYINIGIAVALPDGLIVPVIKNADEKSFLGICKAVNDLATRARSKKLTLDDVQGGTFTITNPGIFGCLFGTPIINQPQVAIMGVGEISKRPVVRNDAIAIADIVNLTLSFDHRIIDGAVADQFMAQVKKNLQNWDIPIH